MIVKRPGEDIKEFPHSKRKRSRSPKKVDFQIEKPPLHEDPSSEKIRNKKILSSILSHLQKAKSSFSERKEQLENQQRIDEKVTFEIKKVAKEIKTQTLEEISVLFMQKIKETELNKKKELDEEILKLEFKILVRYN